MYCINPTCHLNNSVGDKKCNTCGSYLLIEGRFEIVDIIKSAANHPWEVFKVTDNQAPASRPYKILKTLKKCDGVKKPDLDLQKKLFNTEKQVLRDFRNASIPRYVINFPCVTEDMQEIDCLVMEFIDGHDLKEWAAHQKLTNRLAIIAWLKHITKILEYVHARDYVHRDIKPDNIILKNNSNNNPENIIPIEKRRLALVDFGTVGNVNEKSNREGSYTKVLDAPYTAPEQSRNGHQYYKQSDFFALGKTFVYLLTGREPSPMRIELDEWQHETEIVDPESPDDVIELADNGIIPLIDWLMKDDYLDRPKTTEDIIKVIEYVSKKENDVFPNAADTKKFISSIQKPPNSLAQTGENRYLSTVGISIAILAVIAGILNFIITKCTSTKDSTPAPSHTVSSTPASPPTGSHKEVLISFGDQENIDIAGINKEQKKEVILLFNQHRYDKAYEKLYTLWNIEQKKKKEQGNVPDPTLLIYMNNAKVRHWNSQPLEKRKIKTNVQTIVVTAPIKDSRGRKILYGVAHSQNRVVQGNSTILSDSIKNEPTVYLEIGIVNDDNDKLQSPNVAKILGKLSIIGKDGINRQVLTVIGHYTSEVTCEALKNYAEAGLPIISPTSSMDGLGQSKECNPDLKPVFFRTVSSSKLESQALINFLYNKIQSKDIENLRITAFYKQDNPGEKEGFSQNLFKNFQSQYKEKFKTDLNEHIFNLAGDFESGIEDMKKANVIVLFPDGKTNGSPAFENSQKVIIAANRINQSKSNSIKLILASQPLLSADIQVEEFKSWDGKFIMAVDWHRNCPNAEKEFIQEQSDLWGKNDLDRITAQSYEAGQVISKVLEKFSERPSILKKLAVLEEFNITSGVFKNKKITFDKNTGNRDGMNRVLIGSKIASDGKLIFPPIDNNQCPLK
jgi:serine/threonine protein kinase/ABC-type branched-subunit amino acid transport system substrate-binding protein